MIRVTDMIMTINGSPAAMTLDALPAPVVIGDALEVEWERPTVLDSAGPTTLTFEMIRPAWSKMPPPAKDSPVTLTGIISHEPGWTAEEDDDRETVFRGWIDSVTQHPRERGDDLGGLTRFTITATCAIGVLSRTKIGSPPWPREEPAQRMHRVYSIAPQCFDSDPLTWEASGVMETGTLVERDVDSTPAMDVLNAAVGPEATWMCLERTSGLVHIMAQPWYAQTGNTFGDKITNDLEGGRWRVSQASFASGVVEGAHVMPDTDRAQMWDTGLSTVTVSHYIRGNNYTPAYGSSTQRSRTYGQTTGTGQALTIASDLLEGSSAEEEGELSEVPFTPFPTMVELAQSLLRAGTVDAPAVESVTIPLAEVPLEDSWHLREMLHVGPGRFQRLALAGVELGVPIPQRVMGGRLSLSVNGEQTLELTLATIDTEGIVPLTYADLMAHDDITFETFGGGEAIHTLTAASHVDRI